jgi:hypothetical protein
MSDIAERLRNYNPPDRTIDEQRQIASDIAEAAAEIERLTRIAQRACDETFEKQDEVNRLRAILVALRTDCGCELAREACRRMESES